MGYIINEKKKIKISKQVLKGTFSDEISKEMESLWGKELQGISFRCQKLQKNVSRTTSGELYRRKMKIHL